MKIEIMKIKKNEKKNDENNYIIAEINIGENDVNKNIRILNSCEESLRTNPYGDYIKQFKNEDEIKKCVIQINGEITPFNYFYKFKSKGKYTIKYSFKNKLKNSSLMFYECLSLTSIDLSNFNTNNIINMCSMFCGCSSLKSVIIIIIFEPISD